MKICEICKKTISEDEVFGVDGHESVCWSTDTKASASNAPRQRL